MMNPKQVVLTSRYVTQAKRDIVFVEHDAEGIWQFMSDDKVKEEDAVVLSFAQLLEIDESLQDLVDLPAGGIATRANRESDWQRKAAASH